ncbi:MAG: hypothetical protein WCQ46_05600 [Bacteroidales bacterium]
MEKENKMKKLAIGLSIVACILLIALVVIWLNRNNLISDLNKEKSDLTTEFVSLQNDYSTLTTNNDSLNVQLDIEREKVEQLIERIQKTDATNRSKIRQYERELGTLRTIMKGYIVQIDSLNTLNVALRKEANIAHEAAQESKKQYEELRTTTDEYAKQVEIGSVIKGRGAVLVGINSSNKETNRSSRISKLRTCLSLVENSIATKGPKTVYIRVKGPDGILMTDDQQHIFSVDGEDMIYSASREVDYQGDEVEVCIYFSNSQKFIKGVYTVDVYTSEAKICSADLLLR